MSQTPKPHRGSLETHLMMKTARNMIPSVLQNNPMVLYYAVQTSFKLKSLFGLVFVLLGFNSSGGRIRRDMLLLIHVATAPPIRNQLYSTLMYSRVNTSLCRRHMEDFPQSADDVAQRLVKLPLKCVHLLLLLYIKSN